MQLRPSFTSAQIARAAGQEVPIADIQAKFGASAARVERYLAQPDDARLFTPTTLRQRTALGLLGALGLSLAGCLLSEEVCTPADSTYSCCIKQHPGASENCGASGTAIAVGTLTAAATLSSDGELFTGKLRAAVEKALSECAREAHASVNRRRFGGDPTREQCDEVLSKDPDGKSVTRAMQLGAEKHAEATLCAQARLSLLIPGKFALEQQYRIDPMTDQLELITAEKYQELLKKEQGRALRGSVRPDVVIHSGKPLDIQLIYDFKFPRGRDALQIFKATVYRITPLGVFQ